MSEASRFWTTSGTGDGPGGGYTQQQFYDFLRAMLIGDQEASEGVLVGVNNELAISTPSAAHIDVATGAAIVYGFYYENSTTLNLSFTPPGATTGGRVVLEVSWSAQTVRAKIVLNTSGVTTPPSLSQSAGTTWQISLATFQTDNAGNVSSLVDTRTYAHYSTKVSTQMVDDDAITADKAADGIIDASAKLAAAVVTAGKIAAGGVSATNQLADDIVDDTKAGNRVARFDRRQGSSATDWSAHGNSNYTPTMVRMQGGTKQALTTQTVTFPAAFSQPPIVFITPLSNDGIDASGTLPRYYISSIYANGFVVKFDLLDAEIEAFMWLAIGPE